MKFHQWVFKILKKQNVTDGRAHGRTHARTDGQRENSIPPLKLGFGGGYKNQENKTTEESILKCNGGFCKISPYMAVKIAQIKVFDHSLHYK